MADPFGDELDVDVLAASISLDADDLHQLLPKLATRFASVLPDHCKVETEGGWLRAKQVVAVTLALGEHHFKLSKGQGIGVEAYRQHVVRGIVLGSEPLELAEWTAGVAAGLSQLAAQSAHARTALKRFMEG